MYAAPVIASRINNWRHNSNQTEQPKTTAVASRISNDEKYRQPDEILRAEDGIEGDKCHQNKK
jgi:hypothetical protein